jgi:hypothetical protein
MAGRSHSTFKKRQKELARVEKQRDKAEKRQQAGTKEISWTGNYVAGRSKGIAFPGHALRGRRPRRGAAVTILSF